MFSLARHFKGSVQVNLSGACFVFFFSFKLNRKYRTCLDIATTVVMINCSVIVSAQRTPLILLSFAFCLFCSKKDTFIASVVQHCNNDYKRI